MISTFADPFDALLSLQRALEAQLTSDWLQDSTTSRGAFPPINVFQQGQDLLAIIELPGIDKNDLQIQAKENTIRISGKKVVAFPDGVSVHRRERIVGEFDRTLHFRFGSIQVASRPSTRMGFSLCIYRARRATSLVPLRSTERAFFDAGKRSTTMASKQELQVQQKRELETKQETTIPARTFLPTADIFEAEDALHVVLEMPGVEKDNINIGVRDGVLSIDGRLDFSKYKDMHPLYTEYNVGNYSRSFRLSSVIDQNKIGAELRDGVLSLTLPKVEEAKPRSIQIK
jgi:HSP20 family protein